MNETNPSPRPPLWDGAKALGVILPAAILCIGLLVGTCWFLRPAVSEAEKRELTKFPWPTWESLESGTLVDDFMSGKWTDTVSTWYADTFPGREGLMGAYHSLESLFGIRSEQLVQGDVGDEIPDGPMDLDNLPDRPTSGGEGGQQVGGYYLVGDTVYELYSFSQLNAQHYASLINRAEELVGDTANVYDIVIPLHYSFALSAEVQDSKNMPDAKDAISYIYSGLDSGITTVNAYGALMGHKDEYIYFRTDHHWTATGAYYAYEAFCAKAGITPTPLSSYEKLSFNGFLGTLYSKAEQPQALKNNPDTVEAYVPKGTNDQYVYNARGEDRTLYRGAVVRRNTDTFYEAASSKYNCFIMGDQPLIEIHNENISADRKGTTVLLVKESFGNAFAPFLVDSYEYVYIVDYRDYAGSLTGLVSDKGVDDVIFLNVLTAATGTDRLFGNSSNYGMDDFIR